MSVASDLVEHRRVVKEMTLILQEFFHGERTRFMPETHLSPEAYALYNWYRNNDTS